MKPTTEILARISQNSLANKEEVFTKLYRYLLRPDIYFVAYKNLYANNGAATKGVNEDTADGFSEAKIDSIKMCIRDSPYSDVAANTTYGTSRANAYKILEDSLNLRDVRIDVYKRQLLCSLQIFWHRDWRK